LFDKVDNRAWLHGARFSILNLIEPDAILRSFKVCGAGEMLAVGWGRGT
jgi:hypothetical protein